MLSIIIQDYLSDYSHLDMDLIVCYKIIYK